MPDVEHNCPFCKMNKDRIKRTVGSVFAVEDTSPVSPGHMLIIPYRHCDNFFGMTRAELCDAEKLIEQLRKEIQGTDQRVSGFNIGVNCGEAAGQTVCHAHIHLIPRRVNDTPEPRGGVRGVIPDRMSY
ncbi:MAG TPA: HIT family protein [Desulfobacteraceae bacterium]|nr:HIT family protein [Desulfobacteraceae bacterium]